MSDSVPNEKGILQRKMTFNFLNVVVTNIKDLFQKIVLAIFTPFKLPVLMLAMSKYIFCCSYFIPFVFTVNFLVHKKSFIFLSVLLSNKLTIEKSRMFSKKIFKTIIIAF